MKQKTITGFKGLQTLKNSFESDGTDLEIAENVVITQDNIIQKRRGFRQFCRNTEEINSITNFGASYFFFSDAYAFRQSNIALNPQVTIDLIIPGLYDDKYHFTAPAGMVTGDWINVSYVVPDLAAVVFNSYVNLIGLKQVTVIAGEAFVALGAPAIAGALSYIFPAGVTFTYQTKQSLVSTVTNRFLIANKNLLLTTGNGIKKIEREDATFRSAGVISGVSLSSYTQSTNSGPHLPNSNVGYRVVFGYIDDNENTVLGAPSDIEYISNRKIAAASVSFAAPTLTVNTTLPHDLSNGDIAFLYDAVVTGTAIADGTQEVVTVVDPDTFTVDLSGAGVTGVTSASYGVARTEALVIEIPTEVQGNDYFVRIYRSSQTTNQNDPIIEDFRLISEQVTTVGQSVIIFSDTVAETTRIQQAELYTNSTREGILQANDVPPNAIDMCLFRGYAFYANGSQPAALSIDVVAPNLIPNNTLLVIGGVTYIGRANILTNEPSIRSITVASPAVTITYTGADLIAGDDIRIDGQTVVNVNTVNAGNLACTIITGTLANGTYNAVCELLKNNAGQYIWDIEIAGTLATNVDTTARSIVKAINLNTASTVWANYVSNDSGTPGKILLTNKSFDVDFAITASAGGSGFEPVLPTSGTTVSGLAKTSSDTIWVSKVNEPEAVPITNTLKVDSSGNPIIRIVALRDAVIVLTANGVFRINGFTFGSFVTSLMDSTVICKAANSVAVLNNSVYFISNQGVVQVTDSSVRIVSRNIENLLVAIQNQPIDSLTAGCAVESDRMYYLSTVTPNSAGEPDVVYAYNYLTDSWTTLTGSLMVFAYGHRSTIDDSLLLVTNADAAVISKERKDQQKTDYSDDELQRIISPLELCTYDTMAGFTFRTVHTAREHGLKTGDLISFGSSYFTCVVLGKKKFSFNSSVSGSTTTNNAGRYKRGLCESKLYFECTNGSKVITLRTTVPHKVKVGDTITILESSKPLLITPLNTGDFTVTSATSLTFTYSQNTNADATVIQPSLIHFVICSEVIDRKFWSFIPIASDDFLTGDTVRFGSSIYRVISATALPTLPSAGKNILFLTAVNNYSKDFHIVYRGIPSKVRFSPMTGGDNGSLKYFGEFQCAFRSTYAFTSGSVRFSSDSVYSTPVQPWNFITGTDVANFDRIADDQTGIFPNIAELDTEREFFTRPAVPLRMYVPQGAFVATFVQAIVEHSTACESMDIQSVSYYHKLASQRTSK